MTGYCPSPKPHEWPLRKSSPSTTSLQSEKAALFNYYKINCIQNQNIEESVCGQNGMHPSDEFRTIGTSKSTLLEPTPLSNQIHTFWYPGRLLHHVNGNLVNPKSFNQQKSRASRNPCICLSDLSSHPCFLSANKISLKSPKQTQGRLNRLLKTLSNDREFPDWRSQGPHKNPKAARHHHPPKNSSIQNLKFKISIFNDSCRTKS